MEVVLIWKGWEEEECFGWKPRCLYSLALPGEPSEGCNWGTISSPLLSSMMSCYYLSPTALQTILLAEGDSVLQIAFRQASSWRWSLAVEHMPYMRMRQWVSWTIVSLGHSVAYPTRDFFVEKTQPGPFLFFQQKYNFMWKANLVLGGKDLLIWFSHEKMYFSSISLSSWFLLGSS